MGAACNWGVVQLRQLVRSQNHVNVHLASRDVLTIAGLRQLLKPSTFIRIVGTSSDTADTITAVNAGNPDILVVSSTDEQEIEALINTARIASKTLKVVVLTDESVASRLGTRCPKRLEGILFQDGDFLEDIAAVLRIVHRGGRVASGQISRRGRVPSDTDIAPLLRARLLALSARETLILRDVAKGRTNAQIAEPLFVSVATVKADLVRIMDVMQASNRVHLAALASQVGLVDIES